MLIFELLGNTVLLGVNVLVIRLFFARRRVFPKTYIAMMVGNALLLLAHGWAARGIPFLADQSDGSSSRTLVRAILGALIWCTYLVRSRRVKATLVR